MLKPFLFFPAASTSMILMFLSGTLFAQQAGDFKTVMSGEWIPTTIIVNEEEVYINIWAVYDGSQWIPVTDSCDIQYPGASDLDYQYSVTISEGDTVNFQANDSLYFEKLEVFGTLKINSNMSLLETIEVTVNGGTISWETNSVLSLPENSVFIVLNYDSTINNGLKGNPCNNNRRIYIGNIAYAACTGGGNVKYTFDQLNYAGGSLFPQIVLCSESFCLEKSVENQFFPEENPEITVISEISGYFTDSAFCAIKVTGPNSFEYITDTFYFFSSPENDIYPDSIIHQISLDGGFGIYSVELSATDYWTGNSITVATGTRIELNPAPAGFDISQELSEEVMNGNPAIIEINGLSSETEFSLIYNIAAEASDTIYVIADNEGIAVFETKNLFDWIHNGKTLYLTKIINNETLCESLSGTDLVLEVTGGWPLPVDLISFNAECKDNNVSINWVTATEINNDYFILEKSEDLINFHEIAKIPGNGFSNKEIFYSFVDEKFVSGINYYRLKQVDYDGTTKKYNVIAAYCTDNSENNLKATVFPNPFYDIIAIELDSHDYDRIQIELLDMKGVLIRREMYLKCEVAKQSIKIAPVQLYPGTYLLRLVTDSGTYTTTILKHK